MEFHFICQQKLRSKCHRINFNCHILFNIIPLPFRRVHRNQIYCFFYAFKCDVCVCAFRYKLAYVKRSTHTEWICMILPLFYLLILMVKWNQTSNGRKVVLLVFVLRWNRSSFQTVCVNSFRCQNLTYDTALRVFSWLFILFVFGHESIPLCRSPSKAEILIIGFKYFSENNKWEPW